MRNLEKQCSLCNVIFYFTLNNFCEPPKYEHFLAKLFFLVPIIASFCKIWQKVFHAYQKLPERKIFFPPMPGASSVLDRRMPLLAEMLFLYLVSLLSVRSGMCAENDLLLFPLLMAFSRNPLNRILGSYH